MFPDNDLETTPFTIAEYELDLPAMEVFWGRLSGKTPLAIPPFSMRGTQFKRAAGKVSRQTGKLDLLMELEITSEDVPILREIQEIGLLEGHDLSTLRAYLFEQGQIDLETGTFSADGLLYVGDRNWTGLADPNYIMAAGSGQCKDVSGYLGVSVTGNNPSDCAYVCLGNSVTFTYSTANAMKATLLGSDGTSSPLAKLPFGQVQVFPLFAGDTRYHIVLETDVEGIHCEVVVGDIIVTALRYPAPFLLTARSGGGNPPPPMPVWTAQLSPDAFDEDIVVKQIRIDSSYPVKDTSNTLVPAWACSTNSRKRGAVILSPVTYAGATGDDVPIISAWTFSPLVMPAGPDAIVDPAKYPDAVFALEIACPEQLLKAPDVPASPAHSSNQGASPMHDVKKHAPSHTGLSPSTPGYHVGRHTFSWQLQVELTFGDALGGERKRVDGEGSWTFDIPDDDQAVTNFAVRDYEVRLGSFDLYPGRKGGIRPKVTIPAVTLNQGALRSEGTLNRETGQFNLLVEFEATAEEIPILGIVQQLGLLEGADVSHIKIRLFEQGYIDRESGAYSADGYLYVGDKSWRGIGDATLMQAKASQFCGTFSGELRLTNGQQQPPIVCMASGVSLFYTTTNAISARIKSDAGDDFPVPLPSGTATVTPRTAGSTTYGIEVTAAPSEHGPCKGTFPGSTITVVGKRTRIEIVAQLDYLTYKPGAQPIFIANLPPHVADRNIVLDSIQINVAAVPPVQDQLGNIVTRFAAEQTDWQGFNHTFEVTAVERTFSPAFPLAGVYRFQPIANYLVLPSQVSYAHFILRGTCTT